MNDEKEVDEAIEREAGKMIDHMCLEVDKQMMDKKEEKDTTIKDMLNKKSKIWTALEEVNGHN